MPEQIELISKKLAEEPIKIPQNPFWEVFRRFGRDEAIAMIINVIGTLIISFFTAIPILLSVAGPIIEKIGFFPANFIEARKIYKTTPKNQRKHLFHYIKKAMKRSFTSLTEDILVHDPLYIFFMFFGIIIYPVIPVWILAIISFILAVIIVTILEVGVKELQYLSFKRKLKKAGFELESFLEARFFISSKQNPKKLLDKIIKDFKLKSLGNVLEYKDKYFENNLKIYSGRIPKVRLRKRTKNSGKGLMKTLQIVYTRAEEKQNKIKEQYRYFPIKKEKFYFMFKKEIPSNIHEIKNAKIKRILKSCLKSAPQKIIFKRTFVCNKILLFSIDKIKKGKHYYILEIKSWKKGNLLEAMRYIMREFPVVQTTTPKSEMNF